jgi:hypothetical protein
MKSGILVSGCFAAAIGMLAVSETGWILAPIFKLGSTAWALLGILFACRLLGTGYVYSMFRNSVSGDIDLLISERRLGKYKIVCRTSLFDVKNMLVYDRTEKDLKKRTKKPKPDRKRYGRLPLYNYCVDVFPQKYCLLLISKGEASYIKFSPDKRMLEIIKANSII